MAHASIGELGEQVAQEGTQNHEFEQSIIAPLTTQTLTQAPEKICINCATINPVTGHMEDGGSDGGGGGGNGGDSDDGGWRRKHPSCRNARAAKHTYSHLNVRKGTNNICRRSWKSWGFPNSVEIICTAKQKAQTMQNQYEKSLFFLTYIQVPLVNKWTTHMSNWLENEVTAMGVDGYDDWLWWEVALSFVWQFTDTMEAEHVWLMLKGKGLCMVNQNLDEYVTKFKKLTW